MKRYIFIFLALTSFLINAQGGPKVDVIKFRGEVTSVVRNGFDVPVGETWLIYNVTDETLQIGDEDENWQNIGLDLASKFTHLVPDGVSILESIANGLTMAEDITGKFMQISGGTTPDNESIVLRDGSASVSLTNAEINASTNASLTTKGWVLDNTITTLSNNEVSATFDLFHDNGAGLFRGVYFDNVNNGVLISAQNGATTRSMNVLDDGITITNQDFTDENAVITRTYADSNYGANDALYIRRDGSNSPTGDMNFAASGISNVGFLDVDALEGVGTRMVVADANGTLGSQAIPSGVGTGEITTTEILDGTILNADVSASAAIAATKIAIDTLGIDYVGVTLQTFVNETDTKINSISTILSEPIESSGDVNITGSFPDGLTTTINNDVVTAEMLKATNAPTDKYVASFDNATGGVTWTVPPIINHPDTGNSFTSIYAGTRAAITSASLPASVLAIPTDAPSTDHIMIACSDLTTDIATGTSKAYFRMPFAATLTGVKVSLLDAGTATGLTVDINENGTTVLSTKLTTDATEATSATAATAAVISDSALANDAIITIDFDAVPTAGKGVIVTLYLEY